MTLDGAVRARTSCFCGEDAHERVRDTLRGGQEHPIVRCVGCGTLRKYPIGTIAHRKIHRENKQVEELELDALSDTYRERNRIDIDRRVSELRPYFAGDESVLDFGTGMGHFLDVIEPHVGQVVGSEINEKRLKFVRDVLEYPAYDGTSELLSEFGENHFDLVTMFHVLEHLTDPLLQLQKMSRLLADDGMLVVEVPNSRDWLLRFSEGYRNFYYQAAHSFYFTPSSLESILDMADFRADVEGIQRYSLRNAIHWLRTGEPEVQSPSRHRDRWSEPLDKLYGEVITRTPYCDTLWATARKQG